MGDYASAFAASLSDPDGFWAEAARQVSWRTPPTTVLDDSEAPFYRWFPDGSLNTCENALDRHVASGDGDRLALVYDSPVTGTKRTYTYAQLLDETATFAGALASLGVGKGDRVVIYLPMVPEAVVAMLACARLGAVHSVVFGGFAAQELAVRLDDAAPEGGGHRVVRDRGVPGRRVQAVAGPRSGASDPPARPRRAAAAAAGRGGADGPSRHRLAGAGGDRAAGRVRARRGFGPLVRPVHLRHDGPAEGRRARQRRVTPWR